jgi:hypothetical protein
MKIFGLEIGEIGAVLGALGALFGGLLWLIRAGLKTDFASRSEVKDIDARLAEVEGRIPGAGEPEADSQGEASFRGVAGQEQAVEDVRARAEVPGEAA